MNSTFEKDPDATLPYAVDWRAAPSDGGPWLPDGEDIVTSDWDAPDGLTKGADSHDGSKAVVVLSGGTLGELYAVTNTIVTTASNTDQRTIYIDVKDR